MHTMQHMVDPRQTNLFDPFESVFSPVAYRRIRDGWQAVFRHAILELMPADVLAGEFSPDMGTPTKELYSMAGLLVIKEFKNWDRTGAAEAYMFNADVQYALNLEPAKQSLSERTIERYEKLFIENDLAAETMARVTKKLVELLDQDVSRQRLDSTHVFSDMATFARTRMMGVTIQRFLTQVKRHNRDGYDALPEELRSRYAPSPGRLFADIAKDKERRRRLRQEVAGDLLFLIERFADEDAVNGRTTYQNLVRVFGEQCEVVDGSIEVKAHPGGAVMQNPSDADATYNGHKGPGYQAQLAETCSPENEAQLITAAIPQTAAESDSDALPPMLDQLEENDLLPETLYADTLYGSDENEQACAERGVDLQAPVPGAPGDDPDALNIDDFVIDEETETVERCPAGHEPERSEHDAATGKTRTVMPAAACRTCPHQTECPVRCVRGRYVVDHTAKERRLAARRREQATDAFREHYRIRAGIEGTNSGLKRRTGLGRLRCRGAPRVFHAILLKVCGWNILRATATEKMRRVVAEKLARAVRSGILKPVWALEAVWNRLRSPERAAWPLLRPIRAKIAPALHRLVA
jgi:IS5 family transposase